MSLVLDPIAESILQRLQVRRDGFVPPHERPDVRFGRFSPDGTPRISPSQVNTLLMCPARWRHAYLEGLPDPSGYQAIVGSIGHAAMEAALATIEDAVGPRALEAATMHAAMRHLGDPATLAATSNGASANVHQLATSIARSVRQTWDWLLFHDVSIEGVEETIVGRYDHRTAVDSLGVVDLRADIDGRSVVVDWKFPGRSPWQTAGSVEARPAYTQAMHMYADAYAQHDVAVDDVWVVHAGLDGQGVAVAKQAVTEQGLAASRRNVHTAVDRILDQALEPDPVTPGALCSQTWCPFYAACPAT